MPAARGSAKLSADVKAVLTARGESSEGARCPATALRLYGRPRTFVNANHFPAGALAF